MDIGQILKKARVVAVVGISDKPERPSYQVASYLLEQGYEIVPINPNIKKWKGIACLPSLSDVEGEVDIVDIFRKSEAVPDIVDEAITLGADVIWMQLGVINEKSAEIARNAGIVVIMDKCIKIEHQLRFQKD